MFFDAQRRLSYRWAFELSSPPQALWPFVADTNRFNRDIGLPIVEVEPAQERQRNARRALKIKLLGLSSRWIEEPFDWVWPRTFGVLRRFEKGPVRELSSRLEMVPTQAGGTHLTMTIEVEPAHFLGRTLVLLRMKLSLEKALKRIFPEYDRLAREGSVAEPAGGPAVLVHGARERLDQGVKKLLDTGATKELALRLTLFITNADAMAAARFRPYALADLWEQDRRDVLETCLQAVRIGLLEYRWELLCPLCRGPYSMTSLKDLPDQPHCPSCNIDFEANFERAVELTFRPSPAIREVEERTYCVGSPQFTPHVIAQRLLAPGQEWEIRPRLEKGRYRLRALELRGGQHLLAAPEGVEQAALAARDAWPDEELQVSLSPTLTLLNQTQEEQLLILERLAWTDQAATAAEVILLQKFRDLFSAEVLRSGQQVSVGSVAILFTDLKASTEMYRRIGDAPAFGKVLSHFDVLRACIADEGGTMVKTIGDAVMAAFKEPQQALRAALSAQKELRRLPEPLQLKAGVHYGPCIAVTLNDRLDYFGTTVNLAARLVGLSNGEDVIVSDGVYQDGQVKASAPSALPFTSPLKGHGESFALWRVAGQRNSPATASATLIPFSERQNPSTSA
jgi:class 3 adenylate cyclase